MTASNVGPNGPSEKSGTDKDIVESQLSRLDPDSILADDANPNDVLGEDNESDADAATTASVPEQSSGQEHAEPDSKRTSAASAIFSNGSSTGDDNSIVSGPRSSRVSSLASISPDETIRELRDQVSDLTMQVTSLNEKLVRSFNRMADLEDDHSDAQERVRSMSIKIAELEKERAEHLDALNTGLLVEKAHVSSEMQRMMDRVIEETAQRGKAESDKTKIEAELDELSSSLFSEANKMVAVERLSRARAEEKSRNMEERLKDTEGIMVEQQKVLADLQKQVEKLQLSSSSLSSATSRHNSGDAESVVSADSDVASFHRLKYTSLARSLSQRTTTVQRQHRPAADLSAEACLMINIVPYQEFKAFISHLRKLRRQLAPFYTYPAASGPGPRESLNGTPAPRVMSPGLQRTSTPSGTGLSSAANAYSQGVGASLTSASPFTLAGVGRHRDYPTLPSNAENLVHLPNQLSLPFIKRAQEEDVDPCLRLDFAPGLNWLSRRQANTAILEGNLVIEPLFAGGKAIDEDQVRRNNAHLPPAACTLCGIAVVNVPLPGGVAATALSAEQGGKTSLVPSGLANATSSWASSAASSLGSITGSSGSTSSSGMLTPKPSRAGLFSSFRKTSQSIKPADADAPAESNGNSGGVEPTDGGMPADPILLTDIVVPSHIFRLSEGATTRYLLCPHYCLLRLRAACQFWGFVRNLERSIVLEGKYVSEESTLALAQSLPESVDGNTETSAVSKSIDVAALEKAAADSEHADKSEGSKTTHHSSSVPTDTGAEEVKESVVEGATDGATKTDGTAADEPSNGPVMQGIAAPGEVLTDEETNRPCDADDDDFSDATSFPSAEECQLQSAVTENESKSTRDAVEKTTEKQQEAHADAGAETKNKPTQDPVPEEGASVAEDVAGERAVVPPPVPRRSATRTPGTTSPAPALPPRRAPRALADGSDKSLVRPMVLLARSATPINTTLQLSKLETMDWEDRMWTEITKLKEELWRARVGLL
ncbi:hypothetical protein BCV70DRAFT_172806, partial [Testicularia cyperi]